MQSGTRFEYSPWFQTVLNVSETNQSYYITKILNSTSSAMTYQVIVAAF